MAIAYHRVRGEGSRTRLIGRERGYHGVNFGGISVGGIVANRKMFGTLLAGVDHIRHTHDLARNAFSVGLPEHGAELADDLERLVALHDASTIAAVIVEPVAGSTGVLLPPKGYLQRLRAICDKHGILLIFDEVITGFGRIGPPFAAQTFGVTPDLMTVAKGITNGCVPMGAVFASNKIHDAFMNGPEHLIEFFHGYTYSAHPLACAAALGTLDTYADEGLLTRARNSMGYFDDALHSLKGLPNVIDIRNIGLVGGIELAPIARRAGQARVRRLPRLLGARRADPHHRRHVALSPPLIIESTHIDQIVGTCWARPSSVVPETPPTTPLPTKEACLAHTLCPCSTRSRPDAPLVLRRHCAAHAGLFGPARSTLASATWPSSAADWPGCRQPSSWPIAASRWCCSRRARSARAPAGATAGRRLTAWPATRT